MKYYILFLFLAFPLFLIGEAERNDLQRDELKGNIKAVRIIIYDYIKSGEDYLKQIDCSSFTTYNDFGNKTEFQEFFFNDSLESKTVFKYNNDNKIIEEVKYNFCDSILSRITYDYDERGNETEEVHYLGKDLVNYSFTQQYDVNNNSIISKFFDASTNITETSFSDYNEQNKPVRENTVYSGTECVKYSTAYKYDEYGNILEKKENDSTYFYTEEYYKYDYDYKLAEKSVFAYRENQLKGNIVTFYNKEGKEYERRTYNINKDLERRSIIEYDLYGNEIGYLSYNELGNLAEKNTHKYIYDENGRILEHLYYDNDKLEEKNYFRYHENGNKSEHTYTYYSADVEEKCTDTYDTNENLLISKEFDNKGNPTRVYSYEYDDKKNNIRSHVQNIEKNYEIVYLMDYDDNNSCIKKQKIKDGEVLEIITAKFDHNNNCIETIQKNKDGKIIENKSWSYKYNENNEMTEENEYNSGYLTKQVFYENGKKKKEKEIEYNSDKSVKSIVTYEYDQYENEIRCSATSEQKLYYPQYTYKYDENGNEVEHIEYNIDGSIKYRAVEEFDERGNKVKFESYDEDGSLSRVYIYDEVNNLTTVNEYNSEGIEFKKTSRSYNEKGNLTEICIYVRNKLINKRTYNYEGEKKIINEYSYNSEGILRECSREELNYDDNKNWIEKAEYRNDEPVQFTSRVIEYKK